MFTSKKYFFHFSINLKDIMNKFNFFREDIFYKYVDFVNPLCCILIIFIFRHNPIMFYIIAIAKLYVKKINFFHFIFFKNWNIWKKKIQFQQLVYIMESVKSSENFASDQNTIFMVTISNYGMHKYIQCFVVFYPYIHNF